MGQGRYRLVFWNVENLFDTKDDTLTSDDEFTPLGSMHWTKGRYRTKLQHLCQTMVALGDADSVHFNMPAVIGLAEVENDLVLRDLCRSTPLRRFHYDYIHYDSPDQRGIDNALLFRRECFTPFFSQSVNVSDSSQSWVTRDLLCVGGTLGEGDTLCLIVCHLPSQRGGSRAGQHRLHIAQRIRNIMDTLALNYPSAAIVVMGDFNCSPAELRDLLTPEGDDSFTNLMEPNPHPRGSYYYQGAWNWLDQIIVSTNLIQQGSSRLTALQRYGQVFDAEFLLVYKAKQLEKGPYRTYLGPRYQGGYSDHLPVYIDLKHNP